jgi:hypothetical protein
MAQWWWYLDVCEQGLSAALLLAHREGEVELDATQRREARCRQRIVARPSAIDGRVARARRAWVDSGQGKAIWPRADRGLSGRCPLAAGSWQTSPARWPAAAAPQWDRTGEGEREGPVFKLFFSQNFEQKHEKL